MEVLDSDCRIITPKRMEGQSEQEKWQERFFGPFDGILGSILTCQSCSSQVGDHMTFGRNFLIVKHLYELHLPSSFPICICGVCAISTTPAFGRCVTVDFRNAAFLKFAIPCAYLFLLFCWEFCILWTCVLSSY